MTALQQAMWGTAHEWMPPAGEPSLPVKSTGQWRSRYVCVGGGGVASQAQPVGFHPALCKLNVDMSAMTIVGGIVTRRHVLIVALLHQQRVFTWCEGAFTQIQPDSGSALFDRTLCAKMHAVCTVACFIASCVCCDGSMLASKKSWVTDEVREWTLNTIVVELQPNVLVLCRAAVCYCSMLLRPSLLVSRRWVSLVPTSWTSRRVWWMWHSQDLPALSTQVNT
jgi:hypothetical protein